MSATVIASPTWSHGVGFITCSITILTTVDGTSGATCIVPVECAIRLLTGTAVSTNFNGKALSVKASNDGVNFTAVATAISVTSTGNFIIAAADIGFLFYQVLFSGAPTAALTVTLVGTKVK